MGAAASAAWRAGCLRHDATKTAGFRLASEGPQTRMPAVDEIGRWYQPPPADGFSTRFSRAWRSSAMPR